MGVSPDTKAMIDGEFQRMKTIREIKLHHDSMVFLNDAYISLNEKVVTNPRGPLKRCLLHYAAMGDCTNLIHLLLQNGAAVDCRDQHKRTPLSWAAEYAALNTVKILLQNGAEINSIDDMFYTPLGWLEMADPNIGQIAGTESYLREMGAKKMDAKRRWFWETIERIKLCVNSQNL